MVKDYYEISLFMYGHGTGSVLVDFLDIIFGWLEFVDMHSTAYVADL